MFNHLTPYLAKKLIAIGPTLNADKKQIKKAHAMVVSAIKKGIIKKTRCFVCKNPSNQEWVDKGTDGINLFAHHSDYSKPLEVIILCVRCHLSLHAYYRNIIEK